MTREEARRCLQAIKFMLDIEQYSDEIEQALNMAIEALKREDTMLKEIERVVLYGERSEEIQGLEYAENILENILREQDGGRGMNIDDNTIAEAINDITKWRTWSHTYDNACMDGERGD